MSTVSSGPSLKDPVVTWFKQDGYEIGFFPKKKRRAGQKVFLNMITQDQIDRLFAPTDMREDGLPAYEFSSFLLALANGTERKLRGEQDPAHQYKPMLNALRGLLENNITKQNGPSTRAVSDYTKWARAIRKPFRSEESMIIWIATDLSSIMANLPLGPDTTVSYKQEEVITSTAKTLRSKLKTLQGLSANLDNAYLNKNDALNVAQQIQKVLTETKTQMTVLTRSLRSAENQGGASSSADRTAFRTALFGEAIRNGDVDTINRLAPHM